MDKDSSLQNLPLFGTIIIWPLYILATIVGYFKFNLELKYVFLNLAIIFICEWLIRNIVLYQRPGYICLDKNKLTLWYFAGMLRIEYWPRKYQLLSTENDEFIRLKIRGRLLPLVIRQGKYWEVEEGLDTFDFIKLVRK